METTNLLPPALAAKVVRPEYGELIFKESLRHGQPRPYADHEDLWRIHTLHMGYQGNQEPKYVDYGEDHLSLEVHHALRVVRNNVDSVTFKEIQMHGTPYAIKEVRNHDEWHQSWVEYAYSVEPGIVEILIKSPYFD